MKLLALVLAVYASAFVFGLLYRFLLKKIASGSVRGVQKNIGTLDRVVRFCIGIILFVLAVVTSWNPFLLFISGFAVFEAIFSWCGLYAALGKNTCPL